MNEKFTTYSNLLGLVIQQLREEKGFSQQDLADVLGVTRVTVSKIENGQSEITTPMYLKLRETFTSEDIFALTDHKRDVLQNEGINVYDSMTDVPESLKTKDNTAIKYIAGAAALAGILMLFRK